MRSLKNIKSKSDFKFHISDMVQPSLNEFTDNSTYLNLSFYIVDEVDIRNRFSTNSIILNLKNETIQEYLARESKFRKKINKWFNEFKCR